MAWIRWPWTTGKDKADKVAYRLAVRQIADCHRVMMDYIVYHKSPLLGKNPADIAKNMKKLMDEWYGEWGSRL